VRVRLVNLLAKRGTPMIDFIHSVVVVGEFSHHEKPDKSVADGVEQYDSRCVIVLAHLEEPESEFFAMFIISHGRGQSRVL
jgi:hypothetical protein